MSKLLAWTDIKTDDQDAVLEIGVVVTEPFAPWTFRGGVGYVIDHGEDLKEIIASMSPGMHQYYEGNGLLNHLHSSMTVSIDHAETETMELLSRYGAPGDFILSGRGVYRQRAMMSAKLEDWFDPLVTFDLSSVSYLIHLAELSDDIEPRFPDPPIGRAYADAVRYFQEFQLYTQVLHAIPLEDEDDE